MEPNDHFVPQFYLRNFNADAVSKTGRIWVYKKNSQPELKSIDEIACADGYYTYLDKDGKKIREADQLFGFSETRGAPAIKKIIQDESLKKLSPKEFSNLCLFVALLVVRTPRFLKLQQNIRAAGEKELSSIRAEHKESFLNSIKEAGIKFKDESMAEEFRNMLLEKKYDLSYNPEGGYFMGEALLGAMEMADTYSKNHLYLLKNNTSRCFITSDNPVAIFQPNYERFPVGPGNGTLVIPLSNKIAILIRSQPLTRNPKITEKNVLLINKNIMKNSDEEFFSNIKSKTLARMYENIDNKANQKVNVSKANWHPYIFFTVEKPADEIFH